MILQVHTEKELIVLIESLKKELEQLRAHNKTVTKKLKSMQLQIDKKPIVQIKETVIKEISKPIIKQSTIVQTDPAVMPTLKKLSLRLKVLEDKKPELQVIKELTTHEIKTVGAASKQEIEDIKKSILEIKPIVNNLTTGVTSDDVLKLINKHVILSYINKLYGK